MGLDWNISNISIHTRTCPRLHLVNIAWLYVCLFTLKFEGESPRSCVSTAIHRAPKADGKESLALVVEYDQAGHIDIFP